MKKNPLLKLQSFGQSIWLDFIRREMLDSGELARMIDNDGLSGVTSNPAIFEKAIAETDDYNEAIQVLAGAGKSPVEIYEELVVEDIRKAADIFRPLYDRTDGTDGFVSLEVSPLLAHDTAATLFEARRLWERVNRPNLMIKVPGTWEGLPVIRKLIGEGINVNVTLLFDVFRYRAVAEAFLDGLESRASRGLPLERIASVASFFLSRIDTLIDPLLEKKIEAGGPLAALAASLHGETAIASAKAAYQISKEIFGDMRFKRLAAQGATAQRLLWASTGTKNPAYSDVKYVDALIGPGTVNTAPPETLAAYRVHGNPASRLEDRKEEASLFQKQLAEIGIDLGKMTQQLEDEGVAKFVQPFESLMNMLKQKSDALKEHKKTAKGKKDMNKKITTLFLDVGGVMLTNGWDRKSRKLAASTFDLNFDELEERHHLTFDTYEEGKLSLDDYLNRIVFHAPRPFTQDEFRAFMFEQSQPFPEMIELVCRLKERHRLKVAVVSNEGRELTEHRVQTFGLGKFVDFFVSSCFVHYRKPDTDMFRIALDIAQVDPKEVVYIDDRSMFAEVARGLGINGILHTGYETTRKELAEFGLSV